MLRGGSYWNTAEHCRSAYRNDDRPDIDIDDDEHGFRVVLAAASEPADDTTPRAGPSPAAVRRAALPPW